VDRGREGAREGGRKGGREGGREERKRSSTPRPCCLRGQISGLPVSDSDPSIPTATPPHLLVAVTLTDVTVSLSSLFPARPALASEFSKDEARLDYQRDWKTTFLSLLSPSLPPSLPPSPALPVAPPPSAPPRHTPLPSLPPLYSDVLYAPYGAIARFDRVQTRLLRRKEHGILRLRRPSVEVEGGEEDGRESGREGGRVGGREEEQSREIGSWSISFWKAGVHINPSSLPSSLPPSLPPSLPLFYPGIPRAVRRAQCPLCVGGRDDGVACAESVGRGGRTAAQGGGGGNGG
jgi:hypothetical protein